MFLKFDQHKGKQPYFENIKFNKTEKRLKHLY